MKSHAILFSYPGSEGFLCPVNMKEWETETDTERKNREGHTERENAYNFYCSILLCFILLLVVVSLKCLIYKFNFIIHRKKHSIYRVHSVLSMVSDIHWRSPNLYIYFHCILNHIVTIFTIVFPNSGSLRIIILQYWIHIYPCSKYVEGKWLVSDFDICLPSFIPGTEISWWNRWLLETGLRYAKK
jgi:hypothetical protein